MHPPSEPSGAVGAMPGLAAAEAGLLRLAEGNRRFRDGHSRHGHETLEWRRHLVEGQRPFATILGCADSRIPPELVFDQGLGELFVIRVAGNVIGVEVAGSIQYAIHHLGTPLLVVLGHEGCGAVTAALAAMQGQRDGHRYIDTLVDLIEPGLAGVELTTPAPARLSAAVEANVRHSVRQLAESPGGRQLLAQGKGLLVGAVYELETGRVRFLDRPTA